MAEQTTHNQTELMGEIAMATAPLAQWLATGQSDDTTPQVARDFAENALDTRKTGFTAQFAQDQKTAAPATVADTTPQASRRRRHQQLKL